MRCALCVQASIRYGCAICRPTHHHGRRKVYSDWGACCALIAATAKEPRCQMPLLLADVRSFWEIARGVVVKTEAQLVAAHPSSRHGYLIRAMPQRSTPGTEVRVLALADSESAEGTPPCPGLSYPRSPCSPTIPPHHQTLLRPDLLHTSASSPHQSGNRCYAPVSVRPESPSNWSVVASM